MEKTAAEFAKAFNNDAAAFRYLVPSTLSDWVEPEAYSVVAVNDNGRKGYRIVRHSDEAQDFWVYWDPELAAAAAADFLTRPTRFGKTTKPLPAWEEPEAYSVVAVNRNGRKWYQVVRHSDGAYHYWIYATEDDAAEGAQRLIDNPRNFTSGRGALTPWEEPEGYSVCKVNRGGRSCYAVVRHSDAAMDELTFAVEDGAVYLAEYLLQGGILLKGDPYPAWEEPRPSTCGPCCPTCSSRRAGYL